MRALAPLALITLIGTMALAAQGSGVGRMDHPWGRTSDLSAGDGLTSRATHASSTAGWKSATPGRVLRFPADHASHPEYRLEWWYYTGNLSTTSGRRFGYQLTFFRIGLNLVPTSASRWAVRDVFMAHLAIADLDGGRYLSAEKLARPGVGTADARTDGYRVWNGSWGARLEHGMHVLQAESFAPSLAMDFQLQEGRPPVLQGDAGYSRKGSAPGNASHYYSLTRMPTRGTLSIDGKRYDVTGQSWMDHEFGTSFLEPGQVGWDWFALQLDDGTDVMVYALRRRDGSTDAHSSGTIVPASGASTRLGAADFSLAPGRTWTSRATRGSYPVEWSVTVPGAELALSVRAALDAQEMSGGSGVSYWEGAVEVNGTRAGHPVGGRGYLEMTGYAGPPMGQFLN